MYSDCSCVAILIRSNDIEVHGTGKAWYCTTRLLTPHTNLLNFAFHRTISRVGISYCLTSSAEPLLDIPPPSSNCCALMRSLASWGMMRERSDLVKKSSYCAGNFQDWNWLWHKPGKISKLSVGDVYFKICEMSQQPHHGPQVKQTRKDIWLITCFLEWAAALEKTTPRPCSQVLNQHCW